MDALRLLVVDDDPLTASALARILSVDRPNWAVGCAGTVAEGLRKLESERFDAVLVDVRMPHEDGFAFLARGQEVAVRSFTPLIVQTGCLEKGWKAKALRLGASDLVEKPFDRDELINVIECQVANARRYQIAVEDARKLEQLAKHRAVELEASCFAFCIRLAQACELRDENTGNHVIRVAVIAALLGREMGFDGSDVQALFAASALHDLGKLGVPDEILLKQGPLTDDERRRMQHHCQLGANLLRRPSDLDAVQRVLEIDSLWPTEQSTVLGMAHAIALCHHEHWDGRGYPNGLAGFHIPLEARIVAVADVYDALTSDRPYREAWTPAAASKFILERSGSQFDPAIVELLGRHMDVLRSALDDIAGCRREWADAA